MLPAAPLAAASLELAPSLSTLDPFPTSAAGGNDVGGATGLSSPVGASPVDEVARDVAALFSLLPTGISSVGCVWCFGGREETGHARNTKNSLDQENEIIAAITSLLLSSEFFLFSACGNRNCVRTVDF